MERHVYKRIIAERAVNTERQPELDLVKAVIIILFPLIFIPMWLAETDTSVYFITNQVLDGIFASPALVFLMGISIAYYRKKTFEDLVGRSIRLFAAGLILNLLKIIIPFIAAYFITHDYESYIEPLKYLALSNDLLTFASMSIFAMAVLIRLEVSNIYMLFSSIAISILGGLFIGVDTQIPLINAVLGYLVGVEDYNGYIISSFPFCNWFFVVVVGYLFGKTLLRVNNKKLFYKVNTIPHLLIGSAFIVLCLVFGIGPLRENWYSFVHVRFSDAFFEICFVIGLIGTAFFVDGCLPEKIRAVIKRVSSSITWIYIAANIICSLFCFPVLAFGYDLLILSVPVLIPVSLVLSFASICLGVHLKEKAETAISHFVRKNCSIGNRILRGLIIFAAAIILFCGYFIGSEYWEKTIEHISSSAQTTNKMFAEMIDADKAVEYLNGQPKDDYYYDIREHMKLAAESPDIIYIYAILPDQTNKTYTYIWDTEEGTSLGESAAYEIDVELAGVYDGVVTEDLVFYNQIGYGNIATAFYPVYPSSGGAPVLICTDVSVPDVMSTIIQFAAIMTISMLFILILAVGIFYYSIKKNIINPIDTLSNAADNLVDCLKDRDSISIGIKTGDEIEALSHTYEHMFLSMKSYMKSIEEAKAEKARIGAELSIAYDIQQAMLPKEFPKMPELELYAVMDPAKDVGGDFYDFYMLDESHLAFAVADVSGKGIPAALFMVIAKTLIRDNTNGDRSLGEVFEIVNNTLSKSNERGFFVTAFEGVLDLKTGELRYVNAGHEPPFIRRKDGSIELFKPLPGLAIACMEGVEYKEGVIKLEPGDSFFEYTDGVTEATDSNGELYGFDRLKNALDNNREKTAGQLLNAIRADIDAFAGEAPQFDDITMLCFDFKERK